MRFLVPDLSSVCGGAEQLCISVLPGLAKLGVDIIWAVPEHRVAVLARQLPAGSGVRIVPIEWPRTHWLRWLDATARRVQAHALRKKLHLRRVAALEHAHAPDHVLIPWLLDEPVPARSRTPHTVLVLDRNWVRFPSNFKRTPEALDGQLDAWLRTSRHAISISQAVADDVAKALPEHSAKLHSIPLAASSNLTYERWRRVRQGAVGSTFYYPATVADHKGHGFLLNAVKQLRGEFTLALSGHGTERIDAQPNVCAIGYSDREKVDALYLRADVVVLPSLYEGFGLPLAEAISWGARVICSDLPSFREQITRLGVEDAVQLVQPGDVVALSAAMQRELERSPASWEERRQLAARSAVWTWNDVSRAILAVMVND